MHAPSAGPGGGPLPLLSSKLTRLSPTRFKRATILGVGIRVYHRRSDDSQRRYFTSPCRSSVCDPWLAVSEHACSRLPAQDDRLSRASFSAPRSYDRRVIKVTIEAPAERAGVFAQILESEGLEVTYDPPTEGRSPQEVRAVVKLVYWVAEKGAEDLVGGASFALASAAVGKIRERFPTVRAKVDRGPAHN